MPISRSVARISTPSGFASSRMLDRIGMVFRFSTTPCTRWSAVSNSSRAIRNFMRVSPGFDSLSSGDLTLQALQSGCERGIRLFSLGDLLTGVNDRGMVLPAELASDLWERGVGKLPAQVHRDLARMDQRLAPSSRFELGDLDVE